MTKEDRVEEILNLDHLNAKEWPEETVKALDAWKQGDIVRTGLRLFWTAPDGADPITGEGRGESKPKGSLTLALSEREHTTGLSVITSQTCDVVGTGAGKKHPWVQVSPIVRVTDQNSINNIQFGRLLSHFLVNDDKAPGIAADPDAMIPYALAVDLRFSHSVSKSVLVNQTPAMAFGDVDRAQFAARLATKAGRAALHDLISSSLASFLRARIAEEIKDGTWTALVEQFRVVVAEGTRLDPRRVQLLVITKGHADSNFIKKMNSWVERWKKGEKAALRAARIDVERPEVRNIDEISVPTYRDSAHLGIEGVTRQFYF